MSAEYAVQVAVVAALKAAALGAGVYDRVKTGVALPYVHIRGIQGVEDGSDCIDGIEIYLDLDVWSDAVGKPEASQIAGKVRAALHGHELELADPWVLTDLEHRDTNIGDEDDNLVRARMSFRALVERA